MSLNCGSSYHIQKKLALGVVFGSKCNKWLVRILKKGIPITIKSFETKIDEETYFESIIK